MQYTENGIVFHNVIDVSNPGEKNKGQFMGANIGNSVYYSQSDIESNKDWDMQSIINCIDIHWGEAELYGNNNIENTTDLLNQIKNIYNILNNKSASTITYTGIEKPAIVFPFLIANSTYSNQSDIENNFDWDMQFLINCTDINWDKANIDNKTISTTTDLLKMISEFVDQIDNIK